MQIFHFDESCTVSSTKVVLVYTPSCSAWRCPFPETHAILTLVHFLLIELCKKKKESGDKADVILG